MRFTAKVPLTGAATCQLDRRRKPKGGVAAWPRHLNEGLKIMEFPKNEAHVADRYSAGSECGVSNVS